MASPKQTEGKIQTITNAWRDLAAGKSFGGMTLAQFETAVKPSSDARLQVDQVENQLAQAINVRDDADVASLDSIRLVVNGVIGDPTEGPNSALYEAMGYTRVSERKTGLTRKKKTPAKA